MPTTEELLTFEESQALVAQAAKVFQPRTPIATKELFAGRWTELTALADAVNQTGLHAVIYGERGVGKTSLANVVRSTLWAFDNIGKEESALYQRIVVKAVASSGDAFASIWGKLFKEISWKDDRPTIGLIEQSRDRISVQKAFGLGETISVDDVRRILTHIPGAVFIIDEFDRAAHETSREFTDLIKALSDFAVDCTVVLVGVSDTIDQLIADHASIGRAITQIFLRRMTPKELREILTHAESSLSMIFSEEAANLIVHVSQGLPHYTHLIGLHAVRIAVGKRYSRYIKRDDVFAALKEAVKQAEQTAREKHSKATLSSHKDALYRHVLLACALAAARSQDALGYFNPSALVDPLSEILNRTVQIATFSNHLSEFCQEKRGPVLERDGKSRAYRYRFHDPMVVPFAFMDAVASYIVTEPQLAGMLNTKA
jgi:Cdc6-like AAA superfamily ATPase